MQRIDCYVVTSVVYLYRVWFIHWDWETKERRINDFRGGMETRCAHIWGGEEKQTHQFNVSSLAMR